MSTISPRPAERAAGSISPRGNGNVAGAGTMAANGGIGSVSPRASSVGARAVSPRSMGSGNAPRGAAPFVRPRAGNRPPLSSSGVGPKQSRPSGAALAATSPREEDEGFHHKPSGEQEHVQQSGKQAPSALAALASVKGEHGSIEQAHAMIRVLAAQADEARADKTAMWEQTRNDARAMAQVAKNIEGNQGVLAKVVTTLEAQLTAARAEKDAALDSARADKKTWERLLRESERQLREVEKQRAETAEIQKLTRSKVVSTTAWFAEYQEQVQTSQFISTSFHAFARELLALRVQKVLDDLKDLRAEAEGSIRLSRKTACGLVFVPAL